MEIPSSHAQVALGGGGGGGVRARAGACVRRACVTEIEWRE